MTTPVLSKFPVNERVVTSNIQPENSSRMQMDENSLDHLLSLLTDMYSNPYLAILREYATNALDSHVAAGNTAPIEITLPTALDPSYTVTDHGVGMSLEELEFFYGRYGASSKRDDLSQSGAFGIGGKSALTLVDQFSLVAIKDGVKTTVLISKDASGVGMLNVLSSVSTEEPNGVRVSVPIPNPARFAENVSQFFLSWQPGTVLVDGRQPESVYDPQRSTRFGDFIIKWTAGGDSARTWLDKRSVPAHLIMGSITYPIEISDTELWGSMPMARVAARLPGEVFLEAPIGAVDLVGSREGLRYTKRTRDYLTSAFSGFVPEALPKIINERLESASNVDELATALYDMIRANTVVHSSGGYTVPGAAESAPVTWRGQGIPRVRHTKEQVRQFFYELRKDRFYSKHARIEGETGIPVIRYTNANMLAAHQRRIVILGGNDSAANARYESDDRLRRDLRDALVKTDDEISTTDFYAYYIPGASKASKWITGASKTTVMMAADLHKKAEEYRSIPKAARSRRSGSSSAPTATVTYQVVGINSPSTMLPVADLSDVKYYIVPDKGNAITAWTQTQRSYGYNADKFLSDYGVGEGEKVVILRSTQRLQPFLTRMEATHGNTTLIALDALAEARYGEAIRALDTDSLQSLVSTSHTHGPSSGILEVAYSLHVQGITADITSKPFKAFMDKYAWLFDFLHSGTLGSAKAPSRVFPRAVARPPRIGFQAHLSRLITVVASERGVSLSPTVQSPFGRDADEVLGRYPMLKMITSLDSYTRSSWYESQVTTERGLDALVEYVNLLN